MKKNFEKAMEEGWKVLEKHPRVDLHASELTELMERYNGKNVLEVITELWLIGLAYGYKYGKADAEAQDLK